MLVSPTSVRIHKWPKRRVIPPCCCVDIHVTSSMALPHCGIVLLSLVTVFCCFILVHIAAALDDGTFASRPLHQPMAVRSAIMPDKVAIELLASDVVGSGVLEWTWDTISDAPTNTLRAEIDTWTSPTLTSTDLDQTGIMTPQRSESVPLTITDTDVTSRPATETTTVTYSVTKNVTHTVTDTVLTRPNTMAASTSGDVKSIAANLTESRTWPTSTSTVWEERTISWSSSTTSDVFSRTLAPCVPSQSVPLILVSSNRTVFINKNASQPEPTEICASWPCLNQTTNLTITTTTVFAFISDQTPAITYSWRAPSVTPQENLYLSHARRLQGGITRGAWNLGSLTLGFWLTFLFLGRPR